MSLYKKLALLFIATAMILLGSTLGIVYTQSQSLIEAQAEQKAVLLIQTIDSALEAGIPDFQFEAILLHLRQQNPAISSFNIYKLNGYFYDIASTDPNRIGKHAPLVLQRVLQRGVTVTTMHGDLLHIISPILINGSTLYSADVEYSMAKDLASTGVLLTRFLEIGVTAAVLTIAVLWAFSRRLLSRPLLSITAAANDIAGGNLQVDLAGLERRRDEIGMLARSFVRMAEQLTEMLVGISKTADELNAAFQTLVAGGDKTARGALHVSDVMAHMEREVKTQASLAEKVARMTGRLSENVEIVSGMMLQSAGTEGDETREIRSAAEGLVLQINALVDATESMQTNVRDLQGGLKTVVSTTNGQLGWIQEANRSITGLRELASELQKLTSVFDML